MIKRTTALRELLKQRGAIAVPGAPDSLTMRLVEEVGFPMAYFTGAGFSNAQFALPDVGLVSFAEVVTQLDRVCDAVSIPVLADADTGYGNAVNVIRTVRAFEKAGAAGIQLEDQVTPKRCGHFSGKQVITSEEMVQKIKAAVDTRQDSDLVIKARTDALVVNGIEDAIERAHRYAEAGADVIFIESPRTLEELARCANAVPGMPHCANMIEGGLTPVLPLKELDALGFKLVIYANAAMRAAVFAAQGLLRDLHTFGDTKCWLDKMITWEERKRITRQPEYAALEKRYSS